jgi:hypothetical protein
MHSLGVYLLDKELASEVEFWDFLGRSSAQLPNG